MTTLDRELAEDTIDSVASRSEAAVRLAMFVSIAVTIEPALLRAVRRRLAPDLDAGAESAFWFSDLVGSRSAGAVTLDRDVVAVLRERLKASGWLDDARSVIAEVHMHAPATLQVEEELIWRSLRGTAGDADAVETLLKRALKTMVGAPERANDIARWADRALLGLPESLVRDAGGPTSADSPARLLAAASYLRIGSRARLATAPERLTLPASPRWLAPAPNASPVRVGIQLLEVGVAFVEPGTTGSATIDVPDDALRLVQFEWTSAAGAESRVAEARAGITVPLPPSATALRVRTMAGWVYALSASVKEESAGDPAPSAATGAAVDRYKVAKVLVVGDDGFSKRVLLESLTESTIVEGRIEPVVWRVTQDDDEHVRDLVFWDMPTVPHWIGVLSTERAAAVVIVETVGTGTSATEWLDRIQPWLSSEDAPPVFVVATAGLVKGSMSADAVLERVADRRVHGQPVVGVRMDATDRSAAAELRSNVIERIDWTRQEGFDDVDRYHRIERQIFDALDSAGTVRFDTVRSFVRYAFNVDDARISYRVMKLAGVLGALRSMQWPAEQPHYLVFGRRFQATIDAFVRELGDARATMPVVLHGADDGPEGALRSLVMDECERRGVGFQVRVGSARWLVVPAVALEVAHLLPHPEAFQRMDCYGVTDVVRLWWTLLLELQAKDSTVFHSSNDFAEIAHLAGEGSAAGPSFRLTLEQTNNLTIKLWASASVTSTPRLAFGARVEETLRRVAGPDVQVLVDDMDAAAAPLRVRIAAASVDRGRPFSTFALQVKAALTEVTGRNVELRENTFAGEPADDDDAARPPDIYVPLLSHAFAGDPRCMQELQAAQSAQQSRQTIVAPVLWETMLDVELLNRVQPFESVTDDGRSIRDLSTPQTTGTLRRVLTPFIARISRRLDAMAVPGTPLEDDEPSRRWRVQPNTTRRNEPRPPGPIRDAQLMAAFAELLYNGALHPSHPLERTELYLDSTPTEQRALRLAGEQAAALYPAITPEVVAGDPTARERRARLMDDRPPFAEGVEGGSPDLATYVGQVGATLYRYALWAANRYEGAAVELPEWIAELEMRALVPRNQLSRSPSGGVTMSVAALPVVIDLLNTELASALRAPPSQSTPA